MWDCLTFLFWKTENVGQSHTKWDSWQVCKSLHNRSTFPVATHIQNWELQNLIIWFLFAIFSCKLNFIYIHSLFSDLDHLNYDEQAKNIIAISSMYIILEK